jgi:eukaryotic-like serine/threonine-protein kinase
MIPHGRIPVNGTGFTKSDGDSDGDGDGEDELAQVLDAYLAEVEAGRPVDPEEWVGRHPAIADRLRACLKGLHLVEAAAEALAIVPGPRHVNADADTDAEADAGAGVDSDDGPRLGDFRVIRELGRGGMGVVYEAEQHSLGRRVALKVLPFAASIDPRQITRFRVEAQAASQLNHPHIVPVYSVGCERGVHYYAMQLINGPTLAERIDELRGRDATAALLDSQPGSRSTASMSTLDATPAPPGVPALEEAPPAIGPMSSTSARHRASAFFRETARMGLQAAEALEHAHQQGVLHRDIKPSNLIVDGRGHLWVTDFGLARFLGGASLTATGDMLGTLRYMSPEQALANRAIVDQRTDVYSLGATLYEVLALRPAYEGSDRQELLRKIAQEEPRRPSLLNAAIPKDLETIIIKAMAKDPAARYATAQDMADDFGRFLDDRPILARRPGPMERSARWARRHMAALVVAVSLLVLGLAAGIVVVLVKNAEIRRGHAETLKQRGEARRAVREMYTNFAEEWLGRQPNLQPVQREFLRKALEYYQAFSLEKDPDPTVRAEAGEAALRVAEIQRKLGRIDESERAYRQAIAVLEAIPAGALDGRREPDGSLSADVVREYLSTSYSKLGQLLIDSGRSEEAGRTLRRAAELTRALVERTADSPVNRPLLASAYHRLGILLRQTGRPREAEAAYRKAIELGRTMAGSLGLKIQMGAHANLGSLLSQTGRRAEAEVEHRDAVKLFEKLVEGDPGDPLYRHELARTLLGLGTLLENKADGKPEAERTLRRALGLYERLAADAPGVPQFRQELALTLLNLANGLLAADQWREAEPLYERSIELFEALVRQPPIDPSIPMPLIVALQKLADLLRATDRPAEALSRARRAQDLLATLADEDPDVRLERARNEIRLGLLDDPAEAQRHHRRAIAIYEALAADQPDRADLHTATAQARFNLGSLLAAQGDFTAACELLRQAIAAQKDALRLSPRDASIGKVLRAQRDLLSGVLLRLGAHAEAAAVAEDQLRDTGLPAATLAANGLTSCAALAAQDANLTRDARAAVARTYARRARDLLRDAARPGGDPTAPHHLIWFLVSCPVAEFRDPAEAIRMVQNLLERAPDSWVAWATLGAAHYRAGNHRDAIEALERAAALNQGEILYYGFFLAMAHHRLGHKDQARTGFDRTVLWLKEAPRDEDALRLRAEAAELLAQTDRAAPKPKNR